MFYLIKIIRITKAIEAFDIKNLINKFKAMNKEIMEMKAQASRKKKCEHQSHQDKFLNNIYDKRFKMELNNEDIKINFLEMRQRMETEEAGNVELGIIIKNTLKTFKMFMTIFTMSFFLGMLFRTVITFQMVALDEEER